MAKAPVIEGAQMRHAFKVAAVTGQTPTRDVALLHVLYGTGMTACGNLPRPVASRAPLG